MAIMGGIERCMSKSSLHENLQYLKSETKVLQMCKVATNLSSADLDKVIIGFWLIMECTISHSHSNQPQSLLCLLQLKTSLTMTSLL